MKKIEKIFILNFLFKILIAVGVISIVTVAGLSDSESLSNLSVFTFGTVGLVLSALGIWGYVNCSRMIESYKKSYMRHRAEIIAFNNEYNAA